MKTAVVTGAGGFIGGALTEELLKRDYRVYGIDIRPIERFERHPNFVPICADLRTDNLAEQISEKVNYVFHLALIGSMKSKDLYNTDLQIENISAAVRFFKQIAPICGKYVFISSSYEYMRDKGNAKLPLNIYGIAKRAAADMCISIAYRDNIGFVKAVLTNTFGVGDRSDKAVNTIVRSMLENRPLKLVEGNDKNDWVYIDDTVGGLIAVAEEGADFKDYYIGHRDITTFREKIMEMRDLLCPSMELNFGSMYENTYVDYSAIDREALYRDTGFECTADFRESILKTAEWLRKQGETEDMNMVENSNRGGGTM